MASRISDMINPQAARFESGTFYQHYHVRGQYPTSPTCFSSTNASESTRGPEPKGQTQKRETITPRRRGRGAIAD
jgi:hypothetical protein